MVVKASRRLNILSSIKGKRWGLSKDLLIITYKVLIRSIFEYAPFILLQLAESNLYQITKIQNKVIRVATYWAPSIPTTKMLNETNLTDIRDRSIDLTIKYLNKALVDNELIIDLFTDYLLNFEVMEGAIANHKQVRKTLFGNIIEQNFCRLNGKNCLNKK